MPSHGPGHATSHMPMGVHFDDGGQYQSALRATGCARRSEAMEDELSRGAAIVTAVYESAPPPFDLPGRDCRTEHILMARLVVFPEKQEALR